MKIAMKHTRTPSLRDSLLSLCVTILCISSCSTLDYHNNTQTSELHQIIRTQMCRILCYDTECCPTGNLDEDRSCGLYKTHLWTKGVLSPSDCIVWSKEKQASPTLSFQRLLYNASKTGEICLVKYILDTQGQNIDLEERDEDGYTVLMIAALFGNTDVFLQLMRKGCDSSVRGQKNETLLTLAVRHFEKIEIVNYILDNTDVDINSAENDGITALHLSCTLNAPMFVFDLLVKRGADATIRDKRGGNVLILACPLNNTALVKEILKRNLCDVDHTTKDRLPPLLLSVVSGNTEAVDLLMERGANVTITGPNKQNILALACALCHQAMVELILSRQCLPVDSRDVDGATPFLLAARSGCTEVMKTLRQHKCYTQAVDNDGFNALHRGCRSGNLPTVKYILKKKIVKNVNCRSASGETPLHIAAMTNNTDVYDALLKTGADTRTRNKNKQSVLHWACIHGPLNMIEHIVSRHPHLVNSRDKEGCSPLHVAAREGFTGALDVLMRYGADMKACNKDKDTILHDACLNERADMIKHIVNNKYLRIESRGKDGMTPLHTAASCGLVDIFKLLVSLGADVTALDDYNDDILHSACFGGKISMVKYILKKKYVTCLEKKGWQGRTPVHFTAYYGHHELLEFLWKKGCNMKALDNEGNNLLHIAILGEQRSLSKYIIKKNYSDYDRVNKKGRFPRDLAAELGFTDVVRMLS